jgi:predicted amidohydrolase
MHTVGEVGSAKEEVGDLVKMLEQVEGRDAAVLALLWTWLERHLVELGSLVQKAPALARRAREEGPLPGIDAGAIATVSAEPPAGAALVLARLALALGDSPVPIAEEAQGFLGEPVLVFWKAPELARRIGRDEGPPSAQEHPSLVTLAPTLAVCPKLEHGYGLRVARPDQAEWELSAALLRRGLAARDGSLEFHLATMGDHGLSGWWGDEELGVCALTVGDAGPEDQEDALDAFEAAIDLAPAGGVLLLPELAATPANLATISGLLAGAGEAAPALTVVGLYHAEPEEGTGGGDLAPYVNEAVVLGAAGRELWRHRKMTYSEGPVEVDGSELDLVEHIRLGDSLAVIGSPLGTISVVICLDTFAPASRERLLRSPVELLLVPSLSPSVHRHTDSLQHLVQALAGVAFVCNRSPRLPGPGRSRWNDDKNRSFCAAQREHLPAMECREEEATFVLRVDG